MYYVWRQYHIREVRLPRAISNTSRECFPHFNAQFQGQDSQTSQQQIELAQGQLGVIGKIRKDTGSK